MDILRIRLLLESEIYIEFVASIQTPCGKFKFAAVAAPPSPLKVVDPVPAMVVIIPVDIVTLRIRWLPRSAMYTLPLVSTVIPYGMENAALVAGPLSPEKL